MGTGWSFIWAWNASWCIITACNFIALAVGAFFWWPRFIATLLNYFLCGFHLSGVIFMVAGANNTFAQICNYNLSTSTYEGNYKWSWEGVTYESDLGMMLGFGVALSFTWFLQVFFCCLPLYLTPIGIPGVDDVKQTPVVDKVKEYSDSEVDHSSIEVEP